MSKFVYLFGLMMTDGRLATTLLVLMCLAASACALPSSAPSTPDAATIASSLQFCTDEINRYRASIGRPALTRSDSLEQFAATAAQHDASAGVPHSLFSKTNGGGVAMAETLITDPASPLFGESDADVEVEMRRVLSTLGAS